MTLEARISDLAAAIGADIKSLYAAIGSVGNGGGAPQVITATDVSGTYTCQVGDNAVYRLTLSGATSIALPSAGGRLEFLIERPAGQPTLAIAWPGVVWPTAAPLPPSRYLYVRLVHIGGAWLCVAATPLSVSPRVEFFARFSALFNEARIQLPPLPAGTLLLAVIHGVTTTMDAYNAPGWTLLGNSLPITTDSNYASRPMWRWYDPDVPVYTFPSSGTVAFIDCSCMMAVSGVGAPILTGGNTSGVSIAAGASASHTFSAAGVAFNWLVDRDQTSVSNVAVAGPISTLFNFTGNSSHYRSNIRCDIVNANTQATATDVGGSQGSAWWRVLLPLA